MPRIDIVYADFAPCINLLGLLPIGIWNKQQIVWLEFQHFIGDSKFRIAGNFQLFQLY